MPRNEKNYNQENFPYDRHIGCALLQRYDNNVDRLDFYGSIISNKREKNIDTSPYELLGVAWTILLLCPYSEVAMLTVRIDCLPLKWNLNLAEKPKILAAQSHRFMEYDLDKI